MRGRNEVSSVRNFHSVRNFLAFASKASRGRLGESGLARCRLTNKHQHKIITITYEVSSMRNFRSVRNSLISKASRGRVFRSFASKASRGLGESGLARCRLTNKQQQVVIIIIIKGSKKTNAAFSSDLINFQLSALILVLLLRFSILQVIIRNSDAGGAGDFNGDQCRVLPPRGQDSEACLLYTSPSPRD